ncbi:MAG: copper resistance CopC/CopD family protein [Actinomycetota bacterium]
MPAVLAIVAVLLSPGVATAHAFLVRATPAPGERLASPPSSIKLQFSEPVAGGERVDVRTVAGDEVPMGLLQRLQGGLVVEAPLPEVEDGIYVVSWQVVAVDGATTLGEFAFAVGSGGEIPTGQAAGVGPIAWAEAASRWLFLAGLLIAFGGLVSEWLIWSPVTRRYGIDVPRVPAKSLLAAALVGALAHFLLLAGRTAGTAGQDLPRWADLLTGRPGLLAGTQVILAAYALWLVLIPVPWARPWALLPLALAVGAAAVQGHAGTTSTWWAGPSNVIHLVAVGLWVGALAHLVLAAWRLRSRSHGAALSEGARRYAALALGLVALVLGSGAVVGLAQFTTPAEVLSTSYGRVLLIKFQLVAATLGLALTARRRALPSNPAPRPGLLRRLTSIEGATLLATLAAAAVLANAPAPRSATATTFLLGPPPLRGPVVRLAGPAGFLAVFVEAAPHRLQVRVVATSGDLARGLRIGIEGQTPDGREVGVTPRDCGPGCVTTRFQWQQGTTMLAVSVHSTDQGSGTQQFSVPWPPLPEDPALLDRVIETMRAQPLVEFTERVSSGPAMTEGRISISGERFIDIEPYKAGGATDIRRLPGSTGARRLTFYLPGSSIWFLLEIDENYRILQETIVNPGHLIERTFDY